MTNFDLEPWPWRPNLCRADEWFIEWIRSRRHSKHITGPVFHMGTGDHHRVGRACDAYGIECFGLTASEGEEFLKPDLHGYRVILEDIYKLDTEHLQEFQFMTLFHLGEMVDRFGPINVDQINALVRRVQPGGYVFFYKGSSAWDRVKPRYLEQAIRTNLLSLVGHFYDLEYYKRLPE